MLQIWEMAAESNDLFNRLYPVTYTNRKRSCLRHILLLCRHSLVSFYQRLRLDDVATATTSATLQDRYKRFLAFCGEYKVSPQNSGMSPVRAKHLGDVDYVVDNRLDLPLTRSGGLESKDPSCCFQGGCEELIRV